MEVKYFSKFAKTKEIANLGKVLLKMGIGYHDDQSQALTLRNAFRRIKNGEQSLHDMLVEGGLFFGEKKVCSTNRGQAVHFLTVDEQREKNNKIAQDRKLGIVCPMYDRNFKRFCQKGGTK